MRESRFLSAVIVVLMSLAVAICFVLMGYSDVLTKDGTTVAMEYEAKLFDTNSVMEVNITMDQEDWNDLLENPLDETYYECTAEINGEKIAHVGVRTKGNNSLQSVASDPDSDRYSLKLEFDHYVKGQTCYGLDKLVLNNNYADNTYMKEALVYDMFAYLGTEASLYNYAKVYVNGEYRGLYLALEAVEDSFLLRNEGVENGELYKPDSIGINGNGDMQKGQDMREDFSKEEMPSNATDGMPQIPEDSVSEQAGNLNPDSDDTTSATQNGTGRPGMPQSQDGTMPGRGGLMDKPSFGEDGAESENNKEVPEMPEDGKMQAFGDKSFDPGQNDKNGMKGTEQGMGSGSGADLNYTDDDLDSYQTIWDCEVTSTDKGDHKRVVKALKNIFEGNDLDTYMNTDNLLKYAAVHIFSCNPDSLSGSMTHNYYLYESNGQLNLFPWDYNLSFSTMSTGQGDATSIVNSAIDDPFAATDFFDTLLEQDGDEYYGYLEKTVEYVQGGAFETFLERTESLIDELVKEDPTAFCSYEEYREAVSTLKTIVQRRAESIQGQLDGTIPSSAEEQKNSTTLVDCSDLDLSVMGSMNNNKMH